MVTSIRRAALERWLARASEVVEEQQSREPARVLVADDLWRKRSERSSGAAEGRAWSGCEPRDDDVA
ncbi:MAG: hypothetical protein ACRDV4_00180 [Acidimicrobiales bacterium]